MLASRIIELLQARIAESGDVTVTASYVEPNGPKFDITDVTWGSGAGVDEVNQNTGELMLRLTLRPECR